MGQMEENNKKVISRKLIFLDSELDNQEDVLQFVIREAALSGYVEQAEHLYQAVKKREAEIPTAIGYDIAIPHGKTEAVSAPFIAFLRTKNDFQWTEETAERVRLIFLIGVPKASEGKLHLRFISKLSKKLLDTDFRENLLVQTDREKVYQQLNSIEI